MKQNNNPIPSPKDIVTFCSNYDSEILLADGFEEAFLGVGSAFNNEPVAIYDRHKCINILEENLQSMDEEVDFHEQALEYFNFNVQGAYVGERTPIFIDLLRYESGDVLWTGVFRT